MTITKSLHRESINILNRSSQSITRLLWLALILVLTTSVFIGRYRVDLSQLFSNTDPLFWQLFLRVRVPRVLLALLAGSGLAVSGLVTQTIFRNPLADSGIMGISQGAGFGAALGILLFSGQLLWVQVSSFLFSLIALALTISLSLRIGQEKILSLVLAGIAVSALFSSGLGVIKYLADPLNQLPSIVFWLLGSLSRSNWEIFLRSSIFILPLLLLFFAYRWRLNIHALDKKISFSLGMKSSKETYLILSAAVLLTAVIISVTGIVSWVGLIIPNFARIVFGSDTKSTTINTILLGGIFMIICDTLARSVLPGEIPLGIFTALIGSGLFIILLLRRKIQT